MADEMPRLTLVGAGVGLFHQFLHMVLAKQVDGQPGAEPDLLHRAGLTGGAQLHRRRVPARGAGGLRHGVPDEGHRLGHGLLLLL